MEAARLGLSIFKRNPLAKELKFKEVPAERTAQVLQNLTEGDGFQAHLKPLTRDSSERFAMFATEAGLFNNGGNPALKTKFFDFANCESGNLKGTLAEYWKQIKEKISTTPKPIQLHLLHENKVRFVTAPNTPQAKMVDLSPLPPDPTTEALEALERQLEVVHKYLRGNGQFD